MLLLGAISKADARIEWKLAARGFQVKRIPRLIVRFVVSSTEDEPLPANLNHEPILRIESLVKTYVQGQWWGKRFASRALDGVDLTLNAGKTLALVGRSGSGKTTLAMCVAMLEKPDSGRILFEGVDLFALSESERTESERGEFGRAEFGRAMRRPRIQIIFQDSAAALPPRFTAAQIIEEPLLIQSRHSPTKVTAKGRAQLVAELMTKVGLPFGWANRRPNEFSGGERQRLAIARALALQPSLLILDEPFVGLDLSVRGQIVNLLLSLQAERSLSYLYISHDLELVQRFSDQVAVMEQGKIVEQGSVEDVFSRATHGETSSFLVQLLTCRAMSSHR
jgi:ABC-type glutathione transport system ATPase component